MSSINCNFAIKSLQTSYTMARPIKDTPTITGSDAKKFAERLANPTPETKEEKDAAKRAFEAVKSISTFML